MNLNPDPQQQGQNPNSQGQYGGYSGYTPPSQPAPDPYANPQPTYQGYQQQQQQQQQYAYTYQPPASASKGGSSGPSGASDPTTFKMAGRNEALLSYFLWFLTGIFFFLFERKNRFVRFHAAQSTVLFGGATVLLLVFKLIGLIPLLGTVLLSPLISCATLVILIPAGLLWVFLMVMAYRGVTVKLPIIGDYAENLLNRFSKKTTP